MGKRTITLIVGVAMYALQVHAQNLVVNPGFEESSAAKDLSWLFGGDMFVSFGVNGWSQTTEGTTDYFVRGSDSKMNITLHGGPQSPAGGNAFAGFIPWKRSNEYREYITGTLSKPLEKGKKYAFRIKVSTGNKGAYLVNDLSVFFSSEKITDLKTNKTLRHKPQVWLDATPLQARPEEWTTLQNVFIATGDEKYFTFGNFLTDSLTTVKTRTTEGVANEFAYYYADDVTVELTTENAIAPGKATSLADHVQAGKTFIARGINFDLDKATLRPESYLQLHEIVAELKRKPGLNVEVRGYTDSTGNEPHNLQLSKARAKTVADYLISAGIEKNRITFGGYGSANPVSATQPELNRRVEFVFR